MQHFVLDIPVLVDSACTLNPLPNLRRIPLILRDHETAGPQLLSNRIQGYLLTTRTYNANNIDQFQPMAILEKMPGETGVRLLVSRKREQFVS